VDAAPADVGRAAGSAARAAPETAFRRNARLDVGNMSPTVKRTHPAATFIHDPTRSADTFSPARSSPTRVHLRILSAIVTALSLAMLPAHAWQSTRVVREADGRLEYPADAAGNRIPDFSHAGYRGGGVPLPSVPTEATLAHADGDQTNRIQRALDEVAARSPSAAGHRGALLLGPGRWQVDGTIRLTTSGVVLRGSGDGEDPRRDTLLVRQRRVPEPLVQAGQRNDSFRSEKPRSPTAITTPRVALGERAFDVAEPGLFQVGQAVVVHHPSTPAWISRVGGAFGGMGLRRDSPGPSRRPGSADRAELRDRLQRTDSRERPLPGSAGLHRRIESSRP
jgi:hypothetical protein